MLQGLQSSAVLCAIKICGTKGVMFICFKAYSLMYSENPHDHRGNVYVLVLRTRSTVLCTLSSLMCMVYSLVYKLQCLVLCKRSTIFCKMSSCIHVQVLQSSAQCAKSSVLCTMSIMCTCLQSCAQCLSCVHAYSLVHNAQSCVHVQSCAQGLVMCTCLQSCEQSLVTCTWTTVLRTMSTHVYTVKKGKKEQVQETITTSITGNLNGEKMTWKRKKKT